MNRKIGMAGSLLNLFSVIGFAVCMILGSDMGSCLICMVIALSFVLMTSSLCGESKEGHTAAAYSALVFSAIYAAIVLLVYSTPTTAVRSGELNGQAVNILGYRQFGLFSALTSWATE